MLRPTIAVAAVLLVSLALPRLLTHTAATQTQPSVTSAGVDGVTLTITLSEVLTSDSSADATDFTVSLGDAQQSVQTATVNGANVVLTLQEAVPDVDCTDESVMVDYSAFSSSLVGANGGTVTAFTGQAVTNSTDAAPAIDSLSTDESGQRILVTFCEAIVDISHQWSNFSAFTLLVDGQTLMIDDLVTPSSSPGRIELRLRTSDAIKEAAAVTVAYDQSQADNNFPLEDLNQDSKDVESWTARPVTNNVDNPPSLVSVTALWDQITLTYSEALNESSVPDKSAFMISDRPYRVEIESIAVSGKNVTLTTSLVIQGNLSPQFQLAYVPPGTSPLQQADGTKDAPAFDGKSVVSSTPTTKPVFQSAAVDGATLTITFDHPLKNVATAAAFTIGGQTGVMVTESAFMGKIVTLTLSPAVSAGSTITVSYLRPGNPPRIEARNNKDAASFTNQAVANNTIAPVPEFSSAAVSSDGSTLIITFSLALDEAGEHLPAGSTFSLTGTSASVDSVAIDDSTVSLSLSPRADLGETITVGYNPPTDSMAARLHSAADAQPVLAFSGQPVTNNADGKPRPISAEVDSDSLIISFDRSLDSSSSPALTAFSIAGTSATVMNLAFSGSDLILTLSSSVNHTETIIVSYTAPTDSPLKRDGKAIQVDSFTALAVTNLAEDPTPTFESASTDATGGRLTIVMSHPLLATTGGVPDQSTFTLAGSAAAAIDSVSVSGANVVLSLEPAADVEESVTISYQPPTDTAAPALQSVDAMWKTSAWTSESVTNNADGAPRPTEATVNGDSLVLTFDRALDEDSNPPATDFGLMPADISVTAVAIDGASVTLALSTAVEHDDTVTVSYSAADSNKLKRAGKEVVVAMFTGFAVANMTPEPLVRSVVGDGTGIVISFSVMLDTDSTPDPSAFSLGSGEPSVSSVAVSSMTVTLSLSASLVEGAAYTLTYTAPMNAPLQKSDGTAIVDLSEPVTNNTDVAPSVVSISGNAASVTVEFDQALKNSVVPDQSAFTFTRAEETTDVEIAVSDTTVTLTLTPALKEDEDASITYTKPMSNALVDLTGNEADGFSGNIDNQTDTAPMPVSGTIEDDTIIIILDQELYEDPRFTPLAEDSVVYDHFTLTGTDADVEEIRISNEGPNEVGKIVLILSEAVGDDDTIVLTYNPSTGNIYIREDDAGRNRMQINSYELRNVTVSPPAFDSASLRDSLLTLKFDRALGTDTDPSASWFALTPNTLTIQSATIDGSTLELAVTPSATEGDTFTLTYTAPATGGLVGGTGKAVTGLSAAVEVNNVTDYAPFPVSITTDHSGAYMYLRFDQRLDPMASPDVAWFSLEPPHGIGDVIIDPGIEGHTLLITLDPDTPVREGSDLELTYTPPASGGLRDDDAPHEVAGFTQPVQNDVDVAPQVESVTLNGHVLTIEFDQALDENHIPPNCEQLLMLLSDIDCKDPDDPPWFVVQKNRTGSIPISAVIAGNGFESDRALVTLTLSERFGRLDHVAVKYQPNSLDQGTWNLRDTSDPAHQVEGLRIPSPSDPSLTIENVTPAHPTLVDFDRKMPSQITITFDGPLSDDGLPPGPWLLVRSERTDWPIDRVVVQESTLRILLSRPIPECVDVMVEYSSEDGGWVDDSARPIESFVVDVANLINEEWGLKCAQSDFGGVLLTFDDSGPPDRSGFEWSLAVNGEDRQIAPEEVGDVIRLMPIPPVCAGDTIEVRYTQSGAPNPFLLTRRINQAAPCAVSARAEGEALAVTFDSPLDHAALPQPSDFTLSNGVGINAVTRIQGSTLTLTLPAPGLQVSAKPLLSYHGSALTGSGLIVGHFELDVITTGDPPELVSAIGFDSFISLQFDQPLIDRAVPANRFIPSVPRRDDLKVRTVEVSGASVFLELSADLPDDVELFALVYLAKERGGLESLIGARVRDSVFIVENLTETAPRVESAVANDQRVTVTFNQRIEVTDDQASDFMVRAGRRDIAATSLAWSRDGVLIELEARITSLDAVQLFYAPGTAGSVRDSSGIALKPFEFWADNITPHPGTIRQKIDDAALRSSNGETTFARELARGFASSEGVDAVVTGGEGWTTVVRGGLRLSIDAESLGGENIRVHAHRVEHTADVLERIASLPASCLPGADEPNAKIWWVGMSDVTGVPADVDLRIAISGEEIAELWASYCLLDLISGEWRLMRPGELVVGPSLILRRDPWLRPTAELWPLVR